MFFTSSAKRQFVVGPIDGALQGKRGATDSDLRSQDGPAQDRPGQVSRDRDFFEIRFNVGLLHRLDMEPLLNESTRSSCALDYDFKSNTIFW